MERSALAAIGTASISRARDAKVPLLPPAITPVSPPVCHRERQTERMRI